MNKRLKIRLVILTILGLAAGFSLYFALREGRAGILTVAFLNIGQGDAIFIDSPSGNQMLVDGGPGRSILSELGKVMPFYDKSIDVVLATHPDADHVGGLNDVIESYKVDLFLEPGVESDTAIYTNLENKVLEKEKLGKIKKVEARRGMTVDLGGGVVFEVLYPSLDPRGMETNNASIVGRLVYGQNEFLLTGDSPINIEDYLISLDGQGSTLTLKSDVLKAGHHGSRTSTSPEYIKAVSPEYAVISAGLNNKYGHPHQEVLDNLNAANVKTLRTDLQGRIVFESDGMNLKLTP